MGALFGRVCGCHVALLLPGGMWRCLLWGAAGSLEPCECPAPKPASSWRPAQAISGAGGPVPGLTDFALVAAQIERVIICMVRCRKTVFNAGVSVGLNKGYFSSAV